MRTEIPLANLNLNLAKLRDDITFNRLMRPRVLFSVFFFISNISNVLNEMCRPRPNLSPNGRNKPGFDFRVWQLRTSERRRRSRGGWAGGPAGLGRAAPALVPLFTMYAALIVFTPFCRVKNGTAGPRCVHARGRGPATKNEQNPKPAAHSEAQEPPRRRRDSRVRSLSENGRQTAPGALTCPILAGRRSN